MEKEALIFVKELPESCFGCHFHSEEFSICIAFSGIYGDGRYPKYDGKSYYTKEEQKEFHDCTDCCGKLGDIQRFSKCPLRLMSELEGKINVDN